MLLSIKSHVILFLTVRSDGDVGSEFAVLLLAYLTLFVIVDTFNGLPAFESTYIVSGDCSKMNIWFQ